MPHVPAEERSKQIISAASDVIVEEGLARATTRRIAERAEAPLASLHYTFRNKEELVASVYEQWLDEATERLAEAIPEDCGLEEGVRRLMIGFFEWFAAERGMGISQYELMIWSLRTPSARHLAPEVYVRYQGICVGALGRAAGGAVDEEALRDISAFASCATDGVLIKLLSIDDVAACRKDLDRFVELAVAFAADRS